jgi:hypothetical protein
MGYMQILVPFANSLSACYGMQFFELRGVEYKKVPYPIHWSQLLQAVSTKLIFLVCIVLYLIMSSNWIR